MSELPRTTTTGDPKQDLRRKHAGATDVRGDALHHAEDGALVPHSLGVMEAWRYRLDRGPQRRRMLSR
ncbi:MAG: hypothetical protein ABWZ53_08545 [Actinomycetota bacterium]